MTEIHASTRRPKFRGIILIMVLSMGVGMFFLFRGCNSSSSPIQANILFEKGGKKYLFSALGASIVEAAVEREESPPVFNNLLVYQDGDEYFLAPSTIDKITAIANGEYQIHLLKEAGVEGYLTVQADNSYSIQTKYKTSAKLGEQNIINTVIVKNAKGAEMRIEWTYNSKEYEYSNMRNCEVRSFWVKTQHTPGETIYSQTEYLVVPLTTLSKFFNRRMNFDPESNLLRIRE